MGEKKDVLLKHSDILSDKLISEINSFLEYENSSRIRITVISNEEQLKAEMISSLGTAEEYIVEGFTAGLTSIELEDLILSDYIIIHTAAIRMAPLQLIEAIKKVRKFNKKAFVIISKWKMLPQTKENADKVKNSAIKEFSMVNVLKILNVGEKKELGFVTIDETVQIITGTIESDFVKTRNQQINKIYNYYLNVVEQEYTRIKGKANDVRAKLEYFKNIENDFHRANLVKIKNITTELNTYSKDLYDKWKLISIEECIGDMEYDDPEGLRKHIQEQYINNVMEKYKEVTEIIRASFKERLLILRESIISEMHQLRVKIEGLQYLDNELLREYEQDIEELESIETIMKTIGELLDDNTEKLEIKVKSIAGKIFDEETLGDRLRGMLERLAEKYNEDEESVQNRIRKEVTIRNYYSKVLEKCYIQLFSEVDIFINVLKDNIKKKSENILDSYYLKLDRDLSKIETVVEKEYIVI